MRQPTGHRVAHPALTAAAAAPVIRVDHPTGRHRLTAGHVLASDHQTQLVKPGKRRQIRGREDRVRHVWGSPPLGEVFQIEGVGTSIIGRPRPLPRQRPAHPLTYTLDWEEIPSRVVKGRLTAQIRG